MPKVAFEPWGCKVWAFCSGYVLSNLGGPADRERGVRAGGGQRGGEWEGDLGDYQWGNRCGEWGVNCKVWEVISVVE